MASGKTVRVKLNRDGAMCSIPVTFDPVVAFGKLRAPVKVTLNGHTFRSTVFKMHGVCFIPLRRSNREGAKLEGHETLSVRIELDSAKREVKVPADLARALAASPGAKARWKALSYTYRREHVEAITGAKKPETRARRLANTLKFLRSS